MPRPLKQRRVQPGIPRCVFRPTGSRRLVHVTLRRDEAEAIRLADLQGMYHADAARRMGVSRATFGRIVESARRTVADAIINRKCLRIDDAGGEGEKHGAAQ